MGTPMTNTDTTYDVVVVGAGNAALCAALSAAEAGASVLVMEKAPEYLRGGNTYFTGGLFRFAYDAPEQVFDLVPGITEGETARTDLGEYPQPSFERDMMRMTGGRAAPAWPASSPPAHIPRWHGCATWASAGRSPTGARRSSAAAKSDSGAGS